MSAGFISASCPASVFGRIVREGKERGPRTVRFRTSAMRDSLFLYIWIPRLAKRCGLRTTSVNKSVTDGGIEEPMFMNARLIRIGSIRQAELEHPRSQFSF